MRPPLIDGRFIALTLGLLVLGGGAAGAYYWHRTRPETIYESARTHFQLAEDARKKDDRTRARDHYERAERELQPLVEKKAVQFHEAWLLRAQVLGALARMIVTEDGERAKTLRGTASVCAKVAADGNPKLYIAQAMMVDNAFLVDDLPSGEGYAAGLVENLKALEERKERPDVENWENYVTGAYYILASGALRREPLEQKNPDEALKNVKLCMEWERRTAERDPSAARSIPRWRTVEIEARALKIKSDKERRPGRPTGRPASDPSLDELNKRLVEWLDRARRELTEVVPATGNKPPQPLVARLSATNARGLLNVLAIGIEVAPDKATIKDRLELLVDTCEAMAKAPDTEKHISRAAGEYSARIPAALASLPGTRLPDPGVVDAISKRAIAVTNTVAAGASIDPSTFVMMSRTARKEGQTARAKELASRGLDVALKQQMRPNLPAILELRGELAWLLLLEKKTQEAEQHLAELSKYKLTDHVSYMQGLAAVMDGRLEEGARHLQNLLGKKEYENNLPMLLALSHAYMGQSRHQNALPVLERIQTLAQRQQNKEDDPFFRLWLPDTTSVILDLFRANLGLAMNRDVAQSQRGVYMNRAQQYRVALKNTPAGPIADSTLTNTLITQAQQLRAVQPEQADALLDQARQIYEEAPAAQRKDDPRLIWTEVNLILSQTKFNPTVIASGLLANLGGGSDIGVRLAEGARSRSGAAWQWQEAEAILTQLAAQKDNVEAQVGWARWLQMRGRSEEALAYLTEAEAGARTERDRESLRVFRASYLLATNPRDQQTKEAIQSLQGGNNTLSAEILSVLASLESGAPKEEVEKRLSGLVAKHQQNGLLHYWQGHVRRVNGSLAEALPSYERALEFASVRSEAQNGLLSTIIAMMENPKFGPELAHKEATRLRAAHPDDPAILLAFSNTARIVDDLAGMKDALEKLPKSLEQTGRLPEAAIITSAALAATQWSLVGRPDLARQEMDKALKANPSHLPSLLSARAFAMADEDWPALTKLLPLIRKVQPDLPDLPYWDAMLQVALGNTEEAKSLYQAAIEKYPDNPAGFLGLSEVLERAGDRDGALGWVQKWRARVPEDLNGLRSELRLMSLASKSAEAEKKGEEFLQAQLAKLKKDLDEVDRKQPAANDKDKETRAKNRIVAMGLGELRGILVIAGALQDGQAYTEAEAWLRRAQKVLGTLPEEVQKANRTNLQLLLGSVYLAEGQRNGTNPGKKSESIKKAVGEYRQIWEDSKGHVVAGNNLAWLLSQEMGQAEAAAAIIDEVRKGPVSQKPLSGDRLPLEVLDTAGVIYGAVGRNDDVVKLFEEARQRYGQEPQVLLHLGRSLRNQGRSQEKKAYENLNLAIQYAEARLKTAQDPARKSKLEKLISEARAEQKKMTLVPGAGSR